MEKERVSKLATIAAASVCIVAVSAAILYSQRRERKRRLLLKEEEKPQKRFNCVLADNSTCPFLHLPSPDTGLQDGHPYGELIRALAENPRLPSGTFYGDGRVPPGMGGPCVWVQTRGQLEAMMEQLNRETEIGVDIEHHSMRSFLGFTALIQISTHEFDFLVDAIALHDDMHLLRAFFANPAICKVFHGADSDSLWLQRDFHIYIVNLFDTARACDVLGKPQRSLSYLLQTCCAVSTNKVYQRADWRLRPLPAAMEQYARTDAHYLLYIAYCLRRELLQSCAREENGIDGTHKELLSEVLRRSNLLCLQLYEKEGAGVSSLTVANSLLARYYSTGGTPSISEDDDLLQKLVKRLCGWRDSLARAEDESLRFVLSDVALLALATERPLTQSSIFSTIAAADEVSQASDALAGVPPSPSPSLVVHRHITTLCAILSEFAVDVKDSEWPWQSSSETKVCGGFFSNNLFSMHNKSSLFSLLSIGKDSKSRMVMKSKEGGGTETRSREGWEPRIPKRWRLGNVEQARLQFVKKFSCKAPVYHNCRIYADDGRLLCFCDRKKLDWYLKRGLAEDLKEDPPAVRLLFEPKGRPEDENNEFYIQSKTNRCVGCGESSHYLRYRIIPSCYRQHFPEHLKSHRSHDIVLLCVDCHEVAHRAAEKHKHRISLEFGVPLFAHRVVDSGNEAAGVNEVAFVAEGHTGGVSPLQLRTAAMALSRHGSTMPIERREFLEEVVKKYYGGRDIGPQDLQAALLVGMGPREHRRLFKKRNLPPNSGDLSGKRQLDSADFEAVKEDLKMGLIDGGGSQVASDTGGFSRDGEIETIVSKCEDKAEVTEPEEDLHLIERGDGEYTEEEPSNQHMKGFVLPSSKHTRRSIHKESLLGHGPHGRQVVDMLIDKAGDEGIRHFCQQWRTVFVDALQPAFLPPGWEISHSGRREFGDFSVYNPEKRTSLIKD